MIFYSILFYFIYDLSKINGLLNLEYYKINECTVKIETDNGIKTCFNHECSIYKDPWRVIQTYFEDRPCYLHYLKLSFSNYDQFIVFVELQITNNNSLENFFSDSDKKHCFIEV